MADPSSDLNAEELYQLFEITVRMLTFDALRLTPRERQFASLLVSESFAKRQAWGLVGVSFPVRGVPQAGMWCKRLRNWRPSEIWEMLEAWRRAGWVAVDVAEGSFRLAPDQLPGWADAARVYEAECRGQDVLALATPPDLNKELAKFSQAVAKLSHSRLRDFRNLPPGRSPVPVPNVPNVSETFDRTDVKRTNVHVSGTTGPGSSTSEGCENFATLPGRVRKFVGERDWLSPKFWNDGKGWRAQVLTEQAAILSASLAYCQNGLETGELEVNKTRGAMLWNEFQRRRQDSLRQTK